MGWKPEKWKFDLKGNRDRLLLILAVGLIFLILAFPMGPKTQKTVSPISYENKAEISGEEESDKNTEHDSTEAAVKAVLTYEQQLEARLKELLSHVEGVGEVEVMIVLKSSEEKVWRVDKNTSYSTTQETDSNGGSRDIRNQEITESTILPGQDGKDGALLEKELKPQIGGVVVSAAGGGSPAVQAEISAAVEALFDVPSHKIKVLKRAE